MGDAYFGADKSEVLLERMGAAVKPLEKLSAAAKAAFRVAGDTLSGKGSKKSRGGQRYGAKEHAQQGGRFPLGFGGTDKQKGGDGGQLGDKTPQRFNCKEFGHYANLVSVEPCAVF